MYWDKQVNYDIGIPIKGDSMEPEFHYGQTALIKYQSSPDYDVMLSLNLRVTIV